ncbi:hypothetical protein BD769DRAFT_1469718 [Suillus cothurnatus]|nr:hypothetical protein BD769DRAFT_1469718 [Suillus cothurnatus]
MVKRWTMKSSKNLRMDYHIGEDLKEKIIPRAIDYFTGKALKYNVIEEDEEDFDELDDDDEDGQFDDEASDSEVELPRRRGPPKGHGGSSAGAGAVNPEECKQQ